MINDYGNIIEINYCKK